MGFHSFGFGLAWAFNKPIAEDLNENAKEVGMPQWSADDQALAKAVQKEIGVPADGLDTVVKTPDPPTSGGSMGGPSDDIGDISWNLPTIVLRYPANIPNLPGHSWSSAIAMATPIAHKGVVTGAKVQAMTLYDLITKPELVSAAKEYFATVQTKDVKYQSLLRQDDKPATWMNKATMDKYRPAMQKYYYDSSKYGTYLEQLGIKYPTLTKPTS
jgi:aminobenzoyl-glutamate utilization protein B